MLFGLAMILSVAGSPGVFYGGGDPSEIPEVEATGATYKVNGKVTDPLVAMKSAGWTAIRLRIWVNPPGAGWCNLAHTLQMARRVHDAGLRLMLDFHYSDGWADPGKQYKPAAWKGLNFNQLTQALHDYSRDVLKALVDQGTPPEVVQPGNEITNGMLWPDGKVEVNGDGWDNLSKLLKAAISGIREGAGSHQPRIMIHLDQGGRNNVSRLWFDNYFSRGGDVDIIGLSYYPFWHGTMAALKNNLTDLANRYHKDVLVAETSIGYKAGAVGGKSPVPGIAQTPAGQAEYLSRLIKLVKATPGHHGVGVLWWAPAWLPPPGRTRSGFQALTLFDNTGEALPAFFEFGKN
ncbi:MAG: glycoside hydrolase family 53 protein [Fimbriimonadaceae bacterium]